MNTELEMTTDEALLSALSPKNLGDIELKPFSLMRQVIAMDLGRSSGAHFFNAVVTVWVCTLDPLAALKAHADISGSQVKAFEWAEAQGYSLNNYAPLLDAYTRLNKELAASTKVRSKVDDDGNAPKNAGGRPPA
jgi:hypothetical protein